MFTWKQLFLLFIHSFKWKYVYVKVSLKYEFVTFLFFFLSTHTHTCTCCPPPISSVPHLRVLAAEIGSLQVLKNLKGKQLSGCIQAYVSMS